MAVIEALDRAAFLDRDGTIIEEVSYLDRPEGVQLFPWTIDAIRALNRAKLRVVLVSNQSGIARGFFTERVVDEIHHRLASMLSAGGAHIDAYYYCPHHPDGRVPGLARVCGCRKPARGLVDRAVAEFGVDPSRSFVVGDKWLDVGLARAVGAKAALVRTGHGAAQEAEPPGDLTADVVVDDLGAASRWIIASL